MIAHEELLAVIRDNPHDDQRRLVYADRLQELDAPWGELIAVQCAKSAKERSGETTTDA